MTTEKLKNIAKKLPSKPGVYLFKNHKNKALYIGKAQNLKNRVSQYMKTGDFRLQKMVAEAQKVDFMEIDSDIEALILESQYIKKHRPFFNIMMRDDKQYGFVGFTHSTSSGQAGKFPKIFITHQPKRRELGIKNNELGNKQNHNSKFRIHNSEYVGPFTDIGALKTTLRYLRRIFPYCTCKQLHNNYCLNYHIGNCLGFCCLRDITSLHITDYELNTCQKNIRAIKDILSGKRVALVKKLENEMVALGKKQSFEQAIELRQKIEKIKRVFENAKILNTKYLILDTENEKESSYLLKQLTKIIGMSHLPHRIESYDVANIQGKHAVGAMAVFVNGQPDKSQYRKFKIRSKETPDDIAMLTEILERRFKHIEWSLPDLIVVDGGKQQLNATEAVVSSKFKTLNSKQMPVIALTKDGKHKGTKIYMPGKKNPILLSQLPTLAKNMLLHIDSEVHRFAISYYRHRHRKTLL